MTKCSNAQHWDEPEVNCPMCAKESSYRAKLEAVARAWLIEKEICYLNMPTQLEVDALTNLLASRDVAMLEEVGKYVAMRLSIAEPLLQAGLSAGSIVKGGREGDAIAELHGLQDWLRQQAQERRP